MRYIFAFLTLLFFACEKPHPNIEEDIAILQGDIPEPDTTTVTDDCTYDTAFYKLTTEALRGILDVKNFTWDQQERTATVQWRGDIVLRKRGGCIHFYDDLTLVTTDPRPLEDTAYWLDRAYSVSKHFGLPYFPQAIAQREIEFGSERSDHSIKLYSVLPTALTVNDRVFDGLLFIRSGDTTRISMSQYLH